MCLHTGGVSLTLRHRLGCKIKTTETVSTVAEEDDICPLSPSEKTKPGLFQFANQKLPWRKEEEPIKQMLVSGLATFFETCQSQIQTVV